MARDNQTTVSVFILLGFHDLYNLQDLAFLLLIVIYAATISGNLLIITLVATNIQLWSPMYFFLSHLSFCDILISTEVAPNALQVILMGRCPISALSCHAQLFFFGFCVITECWLLTVMSYDRYLAVCDPLRYLSIMNHHILLFLVAMCWTAGFVGSAATVIFVSTFDFCGPNVIDHFFCDLAPVLKLSCSDTKIVDNVTAFIGFTAISQVLFVIITYVCIFTSILRITSISGRQKMFSTCSSHLVVVSTFFLTLLTLYLAPSRGYSPNFNKALSLLNSVITPLFNPIIYSLRNKEIKMAFRKTLLHRSSFNLSSFCDAAHT